MHIMCLVRLFNVGLYIPLTPIKSSVSKVMKRELHTLNVTGSTIQHIEDQLSRTETKGFPIVSPDARQVIMGYIGRVELRYLMGELHYQVYSAFLA